MTQTESGPGQLSVPKLIKTNGPRVRRTYAYCISFANADAVQVEASSFVTLWGPEFQPINFYEAILERLRRDHEVPEKGEVLVRSLSLVDAVFDGVL